MVERDQRTASALGRDLVGSEADPRHARVDTMRRRLRTDAPDANDRIEVPTANLSHAVMNPEPAIPVGITCVGTLVDERSHLLWNQRGGMRPGLVAQSTGTIGARRVSSVVVGPLDLSLPVGVRHLLARPGRGDEEPMISKQDPTAGQPTPNLESLRAQIKTTQAALNAAVAQRTGVLAQIDAAQGQGERVALRNGPLYSSSDQVDRLTVQLTNLQADLRLGQAIAAHPTSSQSGPTPASLRAQVAAVRTSLNDAIARRAGILAQIDAAQGPAERSQLRNTALPGVDGQISRFQGQVASLQAELQTREGIAQTPPVQQQPLPAPPPLPTTTTVPPTPTTTFPPTTGFDRTSMVMGGIATILVLAPLALAVAWRAGRRRALAARRPGWADEEARFARMEEAIASIALDVDRLSESQRFLTSALAAGPAHAQARDTFDGRG